MISPAAFAMGGGMAGLLPANFKNVRTYPEQGKYCRVLNQHLVRRPFKVRLAEMSDLPSLVRLEEFAWAENLRASPEVLRTRLEASPATNLVCEMKGKVVAVLYMQLISSLEDVDQERFMNISALHKPSGRIIQLIAISTHPEVSSMGIGADLKGFALHLARLDQTVDSVIGVTRCSSFKGYRGNLQAYVDEHVAGSLLDPTLDFHTGYGAQVVRLVPGFRPEDTDNGGTGVLIQYNVKDMAQKAVAVASGQQTASSVPTLELLSGIMDDLGYPPDLNDLGKGFFDYGMDSLELVRIRNKLSSSLDMDLPATLLLDFPTVQDLASQLDKERGVGAEEALAIEAGEESPPKQGWDAITVAEILDMQDRCKKMFALPQYQRRFSDLSYRCYPDMIKYILAIEPILLEVEGPIFRDFGLIEAVDARTVQRCRSEFTREVTRYWREVPEVRSRGSDLAHLTKQDQFWG
mmetsp:Transcript_1168/g.3551  ORF Transcript_1168/g.3551 Transcript_1168/m.3551 type:complete len:464 (-) Transcript_1168:20-1411(-)